ncbi:MAG: alpha/beta fold hydrolase [Caulobacteraceae bacterium]
MGGDAAPLFATPLAPIPERGGAEWFAGAGGARLRAALFQPVHGGRGSVVVSPGRTEPIEKYFEVVKRLTAQGFTVLVHDWRGQGLSSRLIADGGGDARGWRDFITDYGALLAAFESRLPRPWIALGHSMGGCLTLLALTRGDTRFSGAVLSAPMLGLKTGQIPAALARLLARTATLVGLGSRLAVRSDAAEPFESNILTHDPDRYRRNVEQVLAWPQLMVGPPTWGWLDFAFQATAFLAREAAENAVRAPLAIVAAGDEQLVDNAASRSIAERIPGARFAVLPGAYHELMQETDEIQAGFWTEFDALVAQAV